MSKHSEQSPMKLSEAIRLGAMLGPKAIGLFWDSVTGGTCAQGAALIAGGALDREVPWANYSAMSRLWPWTNAVGDWPCPRCDDVRDRARSLVAHMNNDHDLTREAIADWVETIEQAQSSALVPRSAENIMEKEVEELAMVNK